MQRQNIVIVGGCGRVGLPLGLTLATRSGAFVTLLDIDAARVRSVNEGRMPFREEGADELLKTLAGVTLTATQDPACLRTAQTVITIVGTPVDEHLNPTVSGLCKCVDGLLGDMQDGSLLILRSTVYPGVTKLVYDRIQASGRKIPLAFCPERISEGQALQELATLPQIVAAFDRDALDRARALFLTIAPSVVELTPPEAELVKLFTNSWRYLNFAISNQFYILAQSFGLDFYRIHDAITRDYPRMRNFARAGFAAGPCLLKDTLQLSAFASNSFFLGHAAMLVNEGLPNFIVERLRPLGLAEKRVAILGMAFKADSDDPRESLSYKLRKLLEVQAREVLCTDPYVSDPTLVPLNDALARADIIILGAPHALYRDLRPPPEKLAIDVWGLWRTHEDAILVEKNKVASGAGH